jgi:hypothetical protein
MKKIMILLLTLSWLTACNVVDANSRETTNQRFDREQRELKAQQAKSNQLLSAQFVGGQPGQISVKGIVVDKSNDKTQLDTRIKISQSLGTSYRSDLKMKIASSNQSTRESLVAESDSKLTRTLTDDKTYVALGCSDVDPTLIAGLRKADIQALTKDVASVSANTVILCGKANITYQFITIAAHNLILMNADISAKNTVGALSLIADNLTVVGKNKIQTQGQDAKAMVLPAPSLELNVLKAIDGEGTLELNYVGGNCIQ